MKPAEGFSREKGFACQPGGGSGFSFFSCAPARGRLAARADASEDGEEPSPHRGAPAPLPVSGGERRGEGRLRRPGSAAGPASRRRPTARRRAPGPALPAGRPARASSASIAPSGETTRSRSALSAITSSRPSRSLHVTAVRSSYGFRAWRETTSEAPSVRAAPAGSNARVTRRAGLRWWTRWKTPPPGRPASARKTIPSKPWFRSAGSRPRIAGDVEREARGLGGRGRVPDHELSLLLREQDEPPARHVDRHVLQVALHPCVATTAPEGSSSARDPRSPTTKKRPRDGCQAMPEASRTPAAAIASGFPRPGRRGPGRGPGRFAASGAAAARFAARLEEQHGQGQDREEAAGQDGQHAQPAVQPPQRAELVEVDARHDVVLHRELGVQLAKPHLAPRAPVGLEVPEDDVLVVAQALGVVVGAALARVRHVRPEAPGTKRLDRLEEEEEGDPGVDEEVEGEEGPQRARHVVHEVGAGGEEEEGDVERAHDHEREARLAVRQLDEVLRLLERVHEGPVALPGVEGADRLGLELGLLLAPLRVVPLRPGHGLPERPGGGSSSTIRQV